MTKQYWILGCIAGLIGGLGLCLAMVWVNIELVDVSYELKQLQSSLREDQNLNAKLEVEYNHLLAPSRLHELAEQHGLQPVEQGSVRRLAP